MYSVTIINADGNKGKSFIVNLESITTLLKMAAPFKATFEIQRVTEEEIIS